MSHFPYPTPPLASGVICLRGEAMEENEFPTPEAEAELTNGRGEDEEEA